MIPPLLAEVTIDDVVRAGACRGGVLEVMDRLGIGDTAVPVDQIHPLLAADEREYVLRAAGMSGYGSGDGYGYGYGSGYGSGDGYGYGDGSGSGSGAPGD